MSAVNARAMRDLPGPRRLPLLGNAHQMRTSRFHLILEDWADRYGPIYRADVGSIPMVVISDREVANTVLRQRPDRYRRWSAMAGVLNEMGIGGIFTAEGDDWRRQRRLAVTALNAENLHRYHDVVAASVERLRERLRAVAANGTAVDLLPILQMFTTEVISTLAFGERPDLLGSRIDSLGPHIQRVFARAAVRVKSPYPYWRKVKLPADRALEESRAVLDVAIADFVSRARRRRAERPEAAPANFLEGMIADPANYSDAEIAGNVMTMLLAGEDTTAHSLAWAVWYAATQPEIQERLRAEAVDVLGDRPVADYAASARLEYAEAAVREAIRLHSPASLIGVEPIADVELLGFAIPAGTRLALMVRHIGLISDSFPQPRVYQPQRWLQSTVEAKGFLPFGAGPRVCPGRGLAYLEGRTALAMLVHAFELRADPAADPVVERFAFTTAPSAVPVVLRERRHGLESALPAADQSPIGTP